MMNFKILDNRAQLGGVVMAVFSLIIIGTFYIIFGYVMDSYNGAVNDVIDNPALSYSGKSADSMNTIFQAWWYIPIIALVTVVLYLINNARKKADTDAY